MYAFICVCDFVRYFWNIWKWVTYITCQKKVSSICNARLQWIALCEIPKLTSASAIPKITFMLIRYIYYSCYETNDGVTSIYEKNKFLLVHTYIYFSINKLIFLYYNNVLSTKKRVLKLIQIQNRFYSLPIAISECESYLLLWSLTLYENQSRIRFKSAIFYANGNVFQIVGRHASFSLSSLDDCLNNWTTDVLC